MPASSSQPTCATSPGETRSEEGTTPVPPACETSPQGLPWYKNIGQLMVNHEGTHIWDNSSQAYRLTDPKSGATVLYLPSILFPSAPYSARHGLGTRNHKIGSACFIGSNLNSEECYTTAKQMNQAFEQCVRRNTGNSKFGSALDENDFRAASEILNAEVKLGSDDFNQECASEGWTCTTATRQEWLDAVAGPHSSVAGATDGSAPSGGVNRSDS